MSRRYKHPSTVLSSNKSFEERVEILDTRSWPPRYSTGFCTTAASSTFEGNSFRMRHHSEAWSQLQGEGNAAAAPSRRGSRQKELTT
jgi:hypothetical protein